MNYRKSLLAGSAAVMMTALALSACSGGGKNGASPAASGSASQAAAQSGDGEKVTIRIMTRSSGTDPITQAFQAAQKEYMQLHPNVTIVDESILDEAAWNNKFKAELATGDLPAIFQDTGILMTAGYAKNGLISDLSADLAADKSWGEGFNESAINTLKLDSFGVPGIYGVPFSQAIEVMYYNTDLFAQAGIDQPPVTYDDLLADIDKLKAAGITPWTVGAKDTWRAGHIHNALFYKLLGLQKAIDLGSGKAKWTDPDVVETFKDLQDLKQRGAFEDGLEGVSYDTEQADFLGGKAAMTLNGTWFMGTVEDSPLKGKVKAFLFPYMADKPEFKDVQIAYPQMLLVNSKLTPEQREHAIGFLKLYTSAKYQEQLAYDAKSIPSRTDVKLDPAKTGDLFNQVIELNNQIKEAGPDTFSFDPLASMADRVRNSIIGLLLGNSPEDTAKEIQAEKDKNAGK